MNNLLEVPIKSVVDISSERAVTLIRAILRCECGYAKLGPSVLTIPSGLTVRDGGIDAEICTPDEHAIPGDCIFRSGLTGFQIKSGTTFKPWTRSAIRSELLDKKGKLNSEVERNISQRGRYTLICTGHDLTSQQRNKSRQHIASVFEEVGFHDYDEWIDIYGASQIAEFAERYPGTAALLAVDPIQEAWLLEEWQRDAHMGNFFEPSAEQSQMILHIQAGLRGETKHIRILGDPGSGKTRLVLEALKDPHLAPYVLYIQHGSQFGQTKLFRQLLKAKQDKPLVLVIDELPESELSDIWRHLKARCGFLKIISLDHGRDDTHDEEIDRFTAPRLADNTIRKIIVSHVGDLHDVDRWVRICEGSPRVAQAVSENLMANPSDLLKSPSTVPIWSRFLHGYGRRNESAARQIDCVALHLALFSRFGYESPVGDEAGYIAALITRVDSTIGWARFQEIVQDLRARRVLQGNRTLFFVPKALHIYLWKQFWEKYGRGFDFTKTFAEMPDSLHAWFMNMFRYAEGSTTAHVIDDILKPDGIFSEPTVLASAKGSRFVSILSEANPIAVLKLLEATIGQWTNQELLEFKHDRQNIVWALEKIAVWPNYTARAIHALSRLAVNENADFSNNATGTLVGLFRIGPEAAVTESTPEERLPAMLKLLRATGDAERRLGLKAMEVALDSHGLGSRLVGPAFQGLKERAKLWIPKTYGDWWQSKLIYFQALVDETKNWSPALRAEVCQTLLESAKHQIKTPPCTELSLQVLGILVDEPAMLPEKLNEFFHHWREYENDGKHPNIAKRLQIFERRYTRRDLASRFRRYVIDVDWTEWDEDFREQHHKSKNRAKILVGALASRIATSPTKLSEIQHLLAPAKNSPALWYFGEQLALYDQAKALLSALTELTLESKHQVCLHGYLTLVRANDSDFYRSSMRGLLNIQVTAWLGATLTLRSEYDDELFELCQDALEKKWISPSLFAALRFGKAIHSVPLERAERLFRQLNEHDAEETRFLVVELLDSMAFNESSPFDSDFVVEVISKAIPGENSRSVMRGYHWEKVCAKLIKWDASQTPVLLDVLLKKMEKTFRLCHDPNVTALADELVRADPVVAWKLIKDQFEKTLPKKRHDLVDWLKGKIPRSDEDAPRGAVADLPVKDILEWIEKDPLRRAGLIAKAAPRTLDDIHGGRLTRELLCNYSQIDGVRIAISQSFNSGGWTGPASVHLKGKREKFRQWLAAGFDAEVTNWIEAEIQSLDASIQHEEIDEERSRFD
jgi:hypothetical protein